MKSKFIIVEQHLLGDGGSGHFLPAARGLLKVAAQRGYDTYLVGGNTFFTEDAAGAVVIGHYRGSSVAKIGDKLVHAEGFFAVMRRKVLGFLGKRVYRKYLDTHWGNKWFAEDTLALFDRLSLGEQDVVYFSWLSDAQVAGLFHYLKGNALSRQPLPRMNFLLWRNLFPLPGMEETFFHQVGPGIRRKYSDCNISGLCDGDLRRKGIQFFTDSERRTKQYNQILGPVFRTIPMSLELEEEPVAAEPGAESGPWLDLGLDLKGSGKCLISMLGNVRAEKGYGELPALIEGCNALSGLASKLHFVIQAEGGMGNEALEGSIAAISAISNSVQGGYENVTLITSRLSDREYAEIFNKTDIILLPYWVSTYYVQTSGPFKEAMMVGKPVLVPHETWMSMRLVQAYVRHVDRLILNANATSLVGTNCTSQLGLTGTVGSVNFLQEYEIKEPGAYVLRVSNQSGDCDLFLKVKVTEFSKGSQVGERELLMECVASGRGCISLGLQPETDRINLSLRNKYGSEKNLLLTVEVMLLGHVNLPGSIIGGMYENVEEIPKILEQMTENQAYYKRTAEAYSLEWKAANGNRALLDMLTGEKTEPVS